MNIWAQVKTVLWSFIGLSGRKRSEVKQVNLVVVLVVAFVLVLLFLGTLAFVAKTVVG